MSADEPLLRDLLAFLVGGAKDDMLQNEGLGKTNDVLQKENLGCDVSLRHFLPGVSASTPRWLGSLGAALESAS